VYDLFPICLAVYIIEMLVGPDLGKVRLQLARDPIIGGRAVKPDAFFGRDWSINNSGGSFKGGDFFPEVFYFFVLLGLPIYKGVKAINLAN